MSDMDTQFSGLRSHAHTFEISSKVYNLITDTFYCWAPSREDPTGPRCNDLFWRSVPPSSWWETASGTSGQEPDPTAWRRLTMYRCSEVSVCVCAQPLSRVQLSATPWTVARQAPLSMGFSRQENWSGLPFPPPGDLPDPGIELASLCLLHQQVGFCFCFYHWWHLGSPEVRLRFKSWPHSLPTNYRTVSFFSLPPAVFSTAGWRLHLVSHGESWHISSLSSQIMTKSCQAEKSLIEHLPRKQCKGTIISHFLSQEISWIHPQDVHEHQF